MSDLKKKPVRRPSAEGKVKSTQAKRRPVAGAKSREEEGLKKVEHRNKYYKDGNKSLYIAACVSILGLFLQVIIGFMVFTSKSERVYFATDSGGSLIPLVALGQPNQKDTVVAQWVSHALIDTFSFNFTDYSMRLNETTMMWYTKEGGDGLLDALNSVGVIDALVERKMLLSLALEHTPILIKAGPDARGVYVWTFQVNAIMTYRTQSQEHTNNVKFMIQVDRRSVMENADGLGITKVIMQRR